MVKQVIGLLADIGAGKTIAARYFSKKYKYKRHTISNYIRVEARKLKKKPTRKNLQDISRKLRNKYGQDYFIRKLLEDIKEKEIERIVIDGLRLPSDIKLCKKKFRGKIKIILIRAKPEIRFKRLKKRGRPGAPASLKEFKEQEKREWKEFKFKEAFKLADYTIHNNGKIGELYQKIDKIMSKIS